MKKYKYVRLDNIEDYDGWEIMKIIPAISDNFFDMAVLSFEDIPKEESINRLMNTIKTHIPKPHKEDKKIEKDDLELDTQIFKYNPTNLETLIIREMVKNRVKIKEIIDRLNGDSNE